MTREWPQIKHVTFAVNYHVKNGNTKTALGIIRLHDNVLTEDECRALTMIVKPTQMRLL